MMAEQTEVRDNRDENRYEIQLDGQLVGLADYIIAADVVTIPHTETSPAFGGRRLASTLVKFSLDDIRARGLRVRPSCPFVAVYIAKNPEYQDLLAD